MNTLKAPLGRVESNRVKICDGCGLPAPLMTERCAMCDRPFRAASPTNYRLLPAGRRYRWLADGEDTAIAKHRDGTWDIADAATGRVDVTLIAVDVDGIRRVAVVDHRARTAATYTPSEGDDLAGLGLVRDSHNEPLLAVRSDGPTGVHVTDVNGTVICVAGPPEDGGDGLEMMVTRAGAPYRRLLLGLSLAIELLRAGELHLA